MSERSKLWILAAGCLVFAQACASVLIAPGFALTVFSDVTQCILLLSGTAALLPNIANNRGRIRLFWGLMTLGIAFWPTRTPKKFYSLTAVFRHRLSALALDRILPWPQLRIAK